ncbi:MAG: GH92 family glycosyl hydrolase [Cellvibrionaceae bacterium]|nr:GH92 family glycosyl hydrolase [Cellvibrionaceae bacterium]
MEAGFILLAASNHFGQARLTFGGFIVISCRPFISTVLIDNMMFKRFLQQCCCYFIICCVCFSAQSASSKSPVELVYPYQDTVNSRWFFFDSASLPFGLVNLSPDTEIGGAWGSGYRYNSNQVKGFSHVHAWQLAALSVMPVSVSSDIPLEKLKHDYFSDFSHATEVVQPGFHQLTLERYNIDVALTATTRVGMHRYRFKKGSPQQVLFNLGGTLGPSNLGHAEAHKLSATAIGGYVTNLPTYRRSRPTKIYFYAEFNRPIAAMDAWRGEHTFKQVDFTNGLDAGLLVHLKAEQSPLLMKVGISYVSRENAKANMDAELPHWQFQRVKKAAQKQWNKQLGKIKVQGGTHKQQRRFYTDLWHALQGRRIISDANGQYMDQTSAEPKVKQIPLNAQGRPAFNHHNSDSFWGAQWTIATLWPLAYPKVASDMTNSLLNYYRDGGMLARGPSGGNYTYVMTGASSTPFIVSNYMKGLRDFDLELAYAAMKKNHSVEGMMSRAGYEHYTQTGGGMRFYLKQGYIPFPLPAGESSYGNHKRGAGMTLEYAFQDYALAQLAKALGRDQDYADLSRRAGHYRNVYDAESGFMRPRNPDGSWQTPFDPYQYENGFVESNPAQGTWNVAHDIDGLAELMGGKQVLIERLDKAFKQAEKQGFTAGSAHADEAKQEFRRIPINYGNQPSMHTAFIFSAAGAPWKSQYWSRKVVQQVYSDLSPELGYSGDEDQGLMGSLAVLMKIGLFQLSAGVEQDPIYYIGSPIFDQITITLDNKYYPGKTFTIKTRDNGPNSPYVSAITLNGKPLDRAYVLHSEIIAGGQLVLQMSNKANKGLN